MTFGFLSRLVVTNPSQIIKWIEPISYKLACLLYHVYDSRLLRKGYINLTIRCIPTSFRTGFPDKARHSILITPVSFAEPTHMMFSPPNTIPGDILEDLSLARCFFMSKWPPANCYPFALLAEEHNIRVYGDPQLTWKDIRVPFLRHIDEDPSLTAHFKGYHLMHHLQQNGDYKESHESHHPMYDIQEAEMDGDNDDEHDYDIGGADD